VRYDLTGVKQFCGKIPLFVTLPYIFKATVTGTNVYYISNEYKRNAGMTVDRCGLLISITSKISSFVRFSLLILEGANKGMAM